MKSVLPISGRMDMDTDYHYVRKGDHVYAINKVFSSRLGAVVDHLGTAKAGTYSVPVGVYYILGALDAGQYIFYALSNLTTIQRIIRYNTTSEQHEVIVDQAYLGFGVGNFVKFQYNEDNDTLYWTDGKFGSFVGNAFNGLGYNPPRRIIVDKARRFYNSGGTDPDGYSAMSVQHLDVIKYPSSTPPTCKYVTDENFKSNLIQGKMLQFLVQYVYEDNTRSVWSMRSQVALPTISESDEVATSLRDHVIGQFQNAVEVGFNTGHVTVTKVRLAVRDGNNGVVHVFREINKELEGYSSGSDEVVYYRGNESLSAVSFDDLYNYDLVPITANDNTLVSGGTSGLSMVYGGIREGFDLVDVTGSSIEVYASRLYDGRPWDGVLQTYFDWREVIEVRALGGATTVLGFEELDLIPVEHLLFESFAFRIDMSFYSGGVETIFITPDDAIGVLGDVDTSVGSAEAFANLFVSKLNALGYAGLTWVNKTIQISLTPPATSWVGEMHSYNPRRTSWKKGVVRSLAITYYDRAGRDCGAIKLPDVYVPFDKEIYDNGLYPDNVEDVRITLAALLDHEPPAFATHYAILDQGNAYVESFERRVVMSIKYVPETGNVQLFLDNWHLIAFNREADFSAYDPSEGDFVRVVRNPEDLTAPYTEPEHSEYVELEIKKVGTDVPGYVYLEVYWADYDQYVTSGNSLQIGINSGIIVEILKRKVVSDKAPYYSLGKTYEIKGANSSSRTHKGEEISNIPCEQVKGTLNYVDVYGDYGWLADGLGPGVDFEITGSSGNNGVYVISAVTVSHSDSVPTTRLFTLTSGMTVDDGAGNDAFVNIRCDQTATGPAIVKLDRGDVYCRQIIQRFRATLPSITQPLDRDLERQEKPYWIESFHYTDKYLSDTYDKGNIYAELSDDQGHKYRRSLLRNSLQYVEGTLLNGLSTFLSPNQASLSEKDGEIVRMLLVGYTLKVIQEDKSSSIYIQKEEISNADGTNQLVTINRVLGGIRPDKEPYGTTHPYSVVKSDADVYFFDQKRKAVIKDTPGGQVLISGINSGMNSFFNDVYSELSSSVNIVGVHDRRLGLIIWSFEKKGDSDNTFTLAYDYVDNRWSTFFSYVTGMYVTSDDDRVYCFNGHALYEQNVGNPREYFTIKYNAEIDLVFNENPVLKKILNYHELNCNMPLTVNPISIPEDTENVDGMETYIDSAWMQYDEGTFFFEMPLDRKSPGFSNEDLAMYQGREMRGTVAVLKYVKSGNDTNQSQMKYAVIGFTPSEPI